MRSESQGKKRGGVRRKVKKSRGVYKNTKYKALDPEINLKTRYEELSDIASYAHTLSEEDKEWLNRFTQEYVCAKFADHDDVLHNTDELRKDCFNRNNARNRDIYTREQAQSTLNYIEDLDPNIKEPIE